METKLNLLTRDGLVFMSFRPALTVQQYGELLDIVEHGTTAEQMREAVAKWAAQHRLEVSFVE